MEWSDETIMRLRGLWAEGHSTAEIGRRLGMTKNAVVGKAKRLELPGRPSPILRDGMVRPPRPKVIKAQPTLPPLASVAMPSVVDPVRTIDRPPTRVIAPPRVVQPPPLHFGRVVDIELTKARKYLRWRQPLVAVHRGRLMRAHAAMTACLCHLLGKHHLSHIIRTQRKFVVSWR